MIHRRDEDGIDEPSNFGRRKLPFEHEVNGLGKRDFAHKLVDRIAAQADLVGLDFGYPCLPVQVFHDDDSFAFVIFL